VEIKSHIKVNQSIIRFVLPCQPDDDAWKIGWDASGIVKVGADVTF
jgi:hypothetical protein